MGVQLLVFPPPVGDLNDVPTVFLEGDNVLIAIIELHEIEFILSGAHDLDALELIVEFLSKFGEIWLILISGGVSNLFVICWRSVGAWSRIGT
jgi:hypothetical protein